MQKPSPEEKSSYDSDEEIATVNKSPNHLELVQFVKEKFPKKGI